MNARKGLPDWPRHEAAQQDSNERGEAISHWTELARALARHEAGFFRRLAAAARDASEARFVAIARVAPAGRGLSFVVVDGPAGTVAALTEENFAPLWRRALEEHRAISEHMQGASSHHHDCAPLRRQGIERVEILPLEGPGGTPVGLLMAGFHSGVESPSIRAALEAYAPLAVLALVEEGRAHRAHENEQWLAALVDSLDSGVLLAEPRGRVRLASSRLAPLLGLDSALMAGIASFDDLLAAVRGNFRDPRAAEARWREIRRRGDEAAWDEIELSRPTPRVLERFARPVADAEGTALGWLEIYRDVTGEREKRSRMAQVEKMAALGQLISGIAHELNNPLTGILGYAQLLLAAPEGAGHSREAGLILAEANRAGAIVRNLLLFARAEAPEPRPVRLNEIIERTLALRQYDLRLENIQAALDLEPAEPVVQADPQALQQLVLNLLINAEQAVGAERRAGRGHITIRTRCAAESRVRLEVRDDGPGIPPEILARIFDPFFTTKPAGVGTGLGLSIVNAIVQSQGGEIRVESEPGRGAVFSVEWPAASGLAELAPPAEPLGAPAAHTAHRPSASRQTARNILVVEDEPTVAQLVADVLRDEGHTVVAILDSFEALERMTREKFDLLICDLKMPRLDGRGFYDEALRRGCTGPDRVLFITGDTLRPRTLQFVQKNSLPFLAKPFMVEELTRAVHSILDRVDSSAPAAPPAPRSAPASRGGVN
jgi:signal transduction histidine kinase/CheY-like chemotaxis protein